jgi:hypothetical protein
MPHLHSVIPPYILRRIIESGSEPQQRCARQTLTHVQTLMAHMPGKPAAPHVNKAGQLERDIYDAKQPRSCRVPRCVTKASRRTAMWRWMKPTII